MDDAQMRTVWQQRQFRDRAAPVRQPLQSLMKYTLAKRVRQFRGLARLWEELIPQSIRDHAALESFHRGVLTVVVDSAPHRFHLRTLLDGGLTAQIQARFSGALNKIRLVPGQFYSLDDSGRRRYEFY